jgi:hypothetical protein
MSDLLKAGAMPPSPFPPNFGPGLSMYNLMEATGMADAAGNPQLAIKGQTQDLGQAIGWMNQQGGRAIALLYVLSINSAPLHALKI